MSSSRLESNAQSATRPRALKRDIDAGFDLRELTASRLVELTAAIALDESAPVKVRLRAIDVRIRLTMGYAPRRTAALVARADWVTSAADDRCELGDADDAL